MMGEFIYCRIKTMYRKKIEGLNLNLSLITKIWSLNR
jgi:hypothetical protein